MNISGGGRVARYYVALSYSRDNGILKQVPKNLFDNNIKLDKYTVRSNVNINLTKTTELAVRVSGTFDSYQGPIDGGASMYAKAIKASPVRFPAFFAPDKQNKTSKNVLFGNYGRDANYLNPYAEMARGYKEYENTVVLAQLELKQDFSFITQGLNGRLLGNVSRESYYDLYRAYVPFYYTIGIYDKATDEYTLSAINPESGTDYLGYTQGAKTISSSIYMEAALSYDRIFRDRHNVSGLLSSRKGGQVGERKHFAALSSEKEPRPRRSFHLWVRRPIFHRVQLRLQWLGALRQEPQVGLLPFIRTWMGSVKRGILEGRKTFKGSQFPQTEGFLRTGGQR